MLSKSRLQLCTFDAEEAVSVKSQTGPGIQYTYARLNSIIENTDDSSSEFDPDIIESPEIYQLLNKISEFPRILCHVSEDMKPHYLTTYTKELNHKIKEFYNNCPVKYADSEKCRSNRLHIVKCCIKVLEICMNLLGIPKIKKM
jgi:arginyl-tRNA synthetase